MAFSQLYIFLIHVESFTCQTIRFRFYVAISCLIVCSLSHYTILIIQTKKGAILNYESSINVRTK